MQAQKDLVQQKGTAEEADPEGEGQGEFTAEARQGKSRSSQDQLFEDPRGSPPSADDDLIARYAKKRGITYEAARSIVGPMMSDISDQDSVRVLSSYVSNTKNLLDAMPDDEITAPVKSAIWGEAGLRAKRGLEKLHGFGGDEDTDFFKQAERSVMRVRYFDRMFDDGDGHRRRGDPDEMPSWAKGLQDQIQDLREEKRAKQEKDEMREMMEGLIAPIRTELEAIKDKEPPPATPGVGSDPEIKALLTKISDNSADQKQDRLLAKLDEVKQAAEGKNAKGLLPTGTIDDLNSLIESIKKLKIGGDTKSDAIMAAIGAAENITTTWLQTKSEEDEDDDDSKIKQKSGRVREKIIDKRMENYIKRRLKSGKGVFNTKEIMHTFGITEEELEESITRLRDSGKFDFAPAVPKGQESKVAQDATAQHSPAAPATAQAPAQQIQEAQQPGVTVEDDDAALDAEFKQQLKDLTEAIEPGKVTSPAQPQQKVFPPIGQEQLKMITFRCRKCRRVRQTEMWTRIRDEQKKKIVKQAICPVCHKATIIDGKKK